MRFDVAALRGRVETDTLRHNGGTWRKDGVQQRSGKSADLQLLTALNGLVHKKTVNGRLVPVCDLVILIHPDAYQRGTDNSCGVDVGHVCLDE